MTTITELANLCLAGGIGWMMCELEHILTAINNLNKSLDKKEVVGQ